MNLALGTVQFGLDYGVSNNTGQVSTEEINIILKTALSHGIKTLDCAAAYGSSEQNLGKNPLSQSFDIVTKIPPLDGKNNNIAKLLENSLTKLKRNSIDTLLLHNADDLITSPNCNKIFEQLLHLKQQGLVNKIGVSVYSPKQLETITEKFTIDAVQVPINFFDQRFLQNNLLDKLHQKNVTVHCRSVFLQGLLLMDTRELPHYFQPYKKKLSEFSELAKELKCTRLTLALAAVVQNPLIDSIVVGCCSSAQLNEIINDYQLAKEIKISKQILNQFSSTDVALINPSLWCLND